MVDMHDADEVSEIETSHRNIARSWSPPSAISNKQIKPSNRSTDRDDFCPTGDDELFAQEDLELEIQMEAEEAAVDDSGEELRGLDGDAEVPIEELLRRYGYPTANAQPAEYGMDEGGLDREGGDDEVGDDIERELPASSSLQQPHSIDTPKVSVWGSAVSRKIVKVQYTSDPVSPSGTPDDEDADIMPNGLEQELPQVILSVSSDSDFVEAAVPVRGTSTTSLRSPGCSENPEEWNAVTRLDRDDDDEGSSSDEEASVSELGSDAERSGKQTPGEARQIPPPFLLRGTLRPYQQAGLEWLASLYSNNINGIL